MLCSRFLRGEIQVKSFIVCSLTIVGKKEKFKHKVLHGLLQSTASFDNGLPQGTASFDNGLPQGTASFDNGLPQRTASFDNLPPDHSRGTVLFSGLRFIIFSVPNLRNGLTHSTHFRYTF